MNDRFKFRAWWKPNYREPIMLYDVEKTYDFMRGKPESICADCFGEVLEDEDYIVMQCTGLKDMNGKLIFEGDIVEVINCRGANAVVEYNLEGAKFMLKGEKFAPSALQHIRKDYFEVIGNIYENEEFVG